MSPDLSNEYYMFNTKVKPFDQVLVRRALSLAIDRESLVTNLTKSGERAAYAFVPGVEGPAPDQDFRSLGERLTGGFNPGRQGNCWRRPVFRRQGFPVIQLLLDDNQNHKAVAEAITGMWQEHLGIQSKLSSRNTGLPEHNVCQGLPGGKGGLDCRLQRSHDLSGHVGDG